MNHHTYELAPDAGISIPAPHTSAITVASSVPFMAHGALHAAGVPHDIGVVHGVAKVYPWASPGRVPKAGLVRRLPRAWDYRAASAVVARMVEGPR